MWQSTLWSYLYKCRSIKVPDACSGEQLFLQRGDSEVAMVMG